MHYKDLPIQRFINRSPELKFLGELVDHFHTEDAELSPEVRNAIQDNAAIMAGGYRENLGEVPEDLQRYVKKTALYAYRVLDKDIDSLKDGGRSEDEIFEATLAAILGSNLARLEKGLALVEGDEDLVRKIDELQASRSSE